ncbi:MAG: CbiQ family ECF transporter T component [Candidatus Dormibacteria bacterium]
MAWCACALVLSLVSGNPAYRLLVALAALGLVAGRAPGRRIRAVLTLVGIAFTSSVLLNLVLGHTGAHSLYRLPSWIPLAGGPATVESVVYGFAAGLSLAAAALSLAPLTLLLEPHQLVEALPAVLHRTGAAVGASLNLVPSLGRSYTAVLEAQQLRGWRPRRFSAHLEVILPTALTAMEDSIQLAEAMEARGFGAGPRTRWIDAGWRAADVAAVGVALFAVAAFILARASGAQLDWYPYPSLTLPPVQPALCGACLLLGAGPLLWPQRTSAA